MIISVFFIAKYAIFIIVLLYYIKDLYIKHCISVYKSVNAILFSYVIIRTFHHYLDFFLISVNSKIMLRIRGY